MLNTRKTTDFRANSSINNEQSSMFITEPPNQQQAATQIRKPTNTFQMVSQMRSTQADSNTQQNSQLTHMMMNMANNKFMNKGHINMQQMNGSTMSEYQNRQPYNDRVGSTLTQVKAGGNSFYDSAMKSTMRQGYASSLGPASK